MSDTLTPQQRSDCMRSVRGKDTSPELTVRHLLHSMGLRYSLHSKKLPGKPDLVFTSRRRVVFVHGCFWQKHKCQQGRKPPATNTAYWCAKLEKNAIRDRQHIIALRKQGWKVLVLWECWTKDLPSLSKRVEKFFDTTKGSSRLQLRPALKS